MDFIYFLFIGQHSPGDGKGGAPDDEQRVHHPGDGRDPLHQAVPRRLQAPLLAGRGPQHVAQAAGQLLSRGHHQHQAPPVPPQPPDPAGRAQGQSHQHADRGRAGRRHPHPGPGGRQPAVPVRAHPEADRDAAHHGRPDRRGGAAHPPARRPQRLRGGQGGRGAQGGRGGRRGEGGGEQERGEGRGGRRGGEGAQGGQAAGQRPAGEVAAGARQAPGEGSASRRKG